MRNLLLAALLASPLIAQESPYVSAQTRDIKAVSADDAQKLREGAGMGLAMAAELNGHPGPKHVLDLTEKLELSDVQRVAVQKIYDAMHVEAVKLGAEILELETRLDRAFAATAIDQKLLASLTAQIGALQGRLRYTHLAAHIETRALLSKHQNVMYAKLRGYGSG
ncbi:MAG TPA: hypothetical protein VE010_00920, partial [Thermoanaerobaculia bacterium]|nr:hypothetical protein [Thermoanaerobaculia bacterium]